MDDRTKGVKDRERMSGRGDEITGSGDPLDRDDVLRRDEEPLRGYSAAPPRDEAPARRTREIREEIEQTREDMSETIDAIQDKLRPRNLVAQATESVRSATSEKVRQISDTVGSGADDLMDGARRNPIPVAMVSIGVAGLAWLAFGGKSREDDWRRRSHLRSAGRRYDSDENYYRPSAAESLGYETAGPYAPGLSYEPSTHSVSSFQRDATVTARKAQNQMQRMLRENPLMIGAAAIVVGAAVGMALPETERENQLMGEARDSVVEGVQEKVRDTAERVQKAAGDVVDQVAPPDTGARSLKKPTPSS
ncbi:MAG: DUF3618 domain-containing protein [Acidobacteria bacterium]|nr:DUF3618 domain-containing protein [Acidobacteriota bacterium]MCA1651149.1 DUF3618 domain-containing protein [Acidobacteriota bacterium]